MSNDLPTHHANALPTVTRMHKFYLNMKAGKTEGTVNKSNPDAKRLRQKIRDIGERLLISPPHLAPAPHTLLRFIDKYSHFGNLVTTPASTAHETHHQAAQTSAATKAVPTNLRRIPSAKRTLQVCVALATSTLLDATEAGTITNQHHGECHTQCVCEITRSHL